MKIHAQEPSTAVSSLRSSYNQILEKPLPVDKQSARVAFFSGEHYEAEIPDGWNVHTLENPPCKFKPLPVGARDYTGLRHGRMTALFFYRQKKPPRGLVTWVCRCDCGRYEFRKPALWLRSEGKELKKDRCAICRVEQEALTTIKLDNKTRQENLLKKIMAFVEQMRNAGFRDEEIIAIRSSGLSITGKTVEQIRTELLLQVDVNEIAP